ncbi:MAG: DUF815 domain-containing protein [Clostridiales bacterium]|jgi:predicted AAA+ superfamily ATPase|nr:DUF815 domain-containing protein [Clostridiales bacterium]
MIEQLYSLTIFRNLYDSCLFKAIIELYDCSIYDKSKQETLSKYCALVNVVYDQGNGNISDLVLKLVSEDDNIYIRRMAKDHKISSEIEHALKRDLLILNNLSTSHGRDLIGSEFSDTNLPDWDTSNIDLFRSYRKTIKNVNKLGFGEYAKHNVFRVKEGKLYPVNNPDPQSLDQLYEYKSNISRLHDNTVAFLNGVDASNALLYGAAGTGKSSTVKAVCNSLFKQGLRLIELDTDQIKYIPDILEQLEETPLKFILFIDDLSVSATDERFCMLKGILEGKSSSYSDNTLIYVTSNRRHMIDESHSDRINSSVHLSDTLQENMSLASRFGLTLTYLKPGKDTYISIVKHLAREIDLNVPTDELILGAEAYALRQNGRSPRTAKQFIKHLLVENSKNKPTPTI